MQAAPPAHAARDVEEEAFPHWRRNLAVCACGSFTTLVAMTLMLPFLPLYVEQLGVRDPAAIVQWSGALYGAAFLTAALTAPLWGRLADRYGRKLMLVRASLGMAVVMSLMGSAGDVWQLLGLRLAVGLLGGYSSSSMVLVATQTPKARTAWALGVLASGVMAGNVMGPLLGGVLPGLIGIRATFHAAGAVIFLAFLATLLLIKRDTPAAKAGGAQGSTWAAVADKRPVFAMLFTGMLLMLAHMSIEPIVTVFVRTLVPADSTVFVSGLVMSAAALGAILSASRLGRLGDRIGHWRVIIGSLSACAVLLAMQALVVAGWQLVALRFAMGLALGGLLPCITAVIRHAVPPAIAGMMLGYSTSSQYVGQVVGPLVGGFFGGHFGMRSVFWGTALVMAGGAVFCASMKARIGASSRLV